MYKFFILGLLGTFFGVTMAFANTPESLSVNADQANFTENFAPQFQRQYQVRWRNLTTGERITGWMRSDSPTCGHTIACSCGGQNYCGIYYGGQTTYFWKNGCGSAPDTIICDAR